MGHCGKPKVEKQVVVGVKRGMIFPSTMGNGVQALGAGFTGWEVVAACYDVAFCYLELIDLTQIAVPLAENMLMFPLKLEIVPVIMN